MTDVLIGFLLVDVVLANLCALVLAVESLLREPISARDERDTDRAADFHIHSDH